MTSVLVALIVAAAVLSGDRRRLPSRRTVTWRRRFGSSPDAADPEADTALLLDLCAAALSSGAPPAMALQVAGQAAGGSLGARCDLVGASLLLGADADSAWSGAGPELAPVRRALALVTDAGVPGTGLLRGAASAERARRRVEARSRAETLGVRMVLPLGLCALPAFAAWGVVPVVLALAGQLL